MNTASGFCLVVLFIANHLLVMNDAFGIFNGNNVAESQATCNWRECYREYETKISTVNITRVYQCLYIDQALRCLNYQLPNCLGEERLDLLHTRRNIERNSTKFNCSDFYTTPTPTVSSSMIVKPTPSVCTSKLPKKVLSNQPVPNAHYNPALSLVNVLCRPNNYHALRQCSMFTYSHVRQFNGSFQSCTLPGSWYLLHHPDVTIEITGGTKIASSVYTKLDKINITLTSKVCTLGTVFNYYAKAGEALPKSLYSTNPTVQALYQPLEFHLDSTKTTASILAPWLNLTIIIRKQDNYLSIVLRMPADLADHSEGICRFGCPSHSQYNIVKQTGNYCLSDSINATKSCSNDAGLLKVGVPLSTHLLQMCIIDILSSNQYNSVLLYKGIVRDHLTLPSWGRHIIPEPNTIIDTRQSTTSTARILKSSSITKQLSTTSTFSSSTLTFSSSSSLSYSPSPTTTTTPLYISPNDITNTNTELHSVASTHYLTLTTLLLLVALSFLCSIFS